MPDVAIRIENLSKVYKLYDRPMDRMKEAFSLTKKKYSKEYFALRGVSCTIEKGETWGIVGKNGSGKSTLLKVITGILTASAGNIEVNGKISALLELGAGFNPEYTGLENVYLNGTMMGYSKEEMDIRIPLILEFADIGEFIHQPVKTYSSGMFARLAFAVSINVEPDILIVDEALSVGDVKFQTKCIDKMKELKEMGTTILFVSHATEQIKRFCKKVIWIDKGEVKATGPSSQIVDRYESFMLYGDKHIEKTKEEMKPKAEEEVFVKPQEGVIAKIKRVILNKDEFQTFDYFEAVVEYEIYEKVIQKFLLGVAIYTPERDYIFGPNTFLDKVAVPNTFGRHCVKYKIPSITLLGGEYCIDTGIFSNEGLVCIDYRTECERIIITNKYFAEGHFFIEHDWEVVQ